MAHLLCCSEQFREKLEADLVRSTIVNAPVPQLNMEEKVLWCFSDAGSAELPHCEKSLNNKINIKLSAGLPTRRKRLKKNQWEKLSHTKLLNQFV